MVAANKARSGLVVLIALSVALWFAAAPVAAQAGDDGGLGFDAGPDGVQIGGEGGINVSVEQADGTGSIDGGGGGGGVNVTAGGDDGFFGGGGGGADVGTDGLEIQSEGGGGDANGNILNAFNASLDANTNGTVTGGGYGTLEVLGQGGTLGCSFNSSAGTPSADNCVTPDTGTGGGFPSPGIPSPEIPGIPAP